MRNLFPVIPSGRWHPISHEQSFFEIILNLLEEDLLGKSLSEVDEKREITQRIETLKKENSQRREENQKSGGRAVFEDVEAKTPVIIEMEKKE